MFVLSRQDTALYRAIAMLVAVALVFMGYGAHARSAEAANLTFVKDTLSDSDPTAVSNHTIQFHVPATGAGIAAGESFTVTFPAGFDLTGIGFDDADLVVNVAEQTLASSSAGATWGFGVSGQDVTFTSGTGTIGAGATVTIEIGTHATAGVTGNTQPVNPAAGTYEFQVTLPTDSGRTRVMIIDNVDVTADVSTSFNFTVSGFATAGTDVNGTTTTGTTTATALPFGNLSAGQTYRLAQRLNVTTNAIHGFVVTVEQDQNLLSSTGADIDGFIDGAYTDTPTTWATPTNNIGQENTWGHWGLTSSDSDLNSDEFGSDLWVAASTTPREVFTHDGPSDGTTADIGSTTVGYAVQITALQEAADDYATTLTYIATPTF